METQDAYRLRSLREGYVSPYIQRHPRKPLQEGSEYGICLEPFTDVIKQPELTTWCSICGENAHKECVERWHLEEVGAGRTCPFCCGSWSGSSHTRPSIQRGLRVAMLYRQSSAMLAERRRRNYSRRQNDDADIMMETLSLTVEIRDLETWPATQEQTTTAESDGDPFAHENEMFENGDMFGSEGNNGNDGGRLE
ncbi:hypothetical protein HYALB_00010651 [Hymenoscyphus albidus]|uniref:RING-type domain-containing protein n=1 Tax=Hymenoscyphus albidus TaxID=595503 RepID=A0A9N9LT99_9HELO|nr:hypothetical protein HYALB_00010651 [Hymenoscyphus albidus]